MSNVEKHSPTVDDATATPLSPAVQAVPPEAFVDEGSALLKPSSGRSAMERGMRRLLAIPELSITIVIVVLMLVFACFNSAMFSGPTLASMLKAMATIGIIAIGQTLLLIVGEIDISVGSVVGLCGVVSAYCMGSDYLHLPWPVGVTVALAAGALIGLINGLLAVKVGLPAFIVTLSMLYIAKGSTYLLCHGYPIGKLPASFRAIGQAQPLGISWAFWMFIGLAAFFQLVLSRTIWGRALYATGGNAEVARIAGIRTGGVKITCYIITSMLAALSGIILTSQYNVAQPENGTSWELQTIAGTVVGGVSLFGGMGTVTAAVLGLLLMQVVNMGLNLCHVNTNWQTVAVGVIMIIAVGVDLLRRRAKIME